ncbi:MAG: DUF4830 domain-containing protein [Eubacteriales bacterium]|jgi:hypothetical protein|nr:DUF4830 domain-containing protein [Clostridiales bacterium]
MFIYAVRANTIKFFSLIGLAVLTIAALIVFIPKAQQPAGGTEVAPADVEVRESISFEKVKTNADRIAFLQSFGWEVDPEPVEEAKVTIPAEFDRVFESYNAIQKQQGLDLSKYKNRDMTRYTYKVLNYPNYDGTVYANILVYRNRVVAGDICSADVNGFIKGLSGK